MKWLLTALVLVFYALHQDFWNWNDPSLVGGILPVGLAYQAGYSILAAVLMGLLVKFAWPSAVEESVTAEPAAGSNLPPQQASVSCPAEGAEE